MNLGAVLPICIRGSYDIDDLGRSEILFKSLSAFCEPGLFAEFLVVTPDDEVDIVAERCEKWHQFNIKVISEEVLCPELKNHRHVRGWRKQQMVKLAAPRKLTTPYYVTFDADAICLKPLSKSLLIPNGKALLQYEKRALHPKWWTHSARILKTSANVGDTQLGMTVTPAIMASELSVLTAREIEKHLRGKGTWVDKLCRLHNPKSPSNWTLYRHLRGRWTEYSLYYICAMKYGVLNNYHVSAGTAEHPALMLIHDSHPYASWNPKISFDMANPGLFCVVNSSIRLEPSEVWNKVSPYIPYKKNESEQ